MVSIRLYPERGALLSQEGERVSHERLFDRGQTRYDWQHYLPLIERKPGALRNGAPFADLPAPLQRLRGRLLKREGGDRTMAEVLAAVLVAVELVLESGAVNAEHIHNVLARLQPTPAIPKVETHLCVTEAPMADAGRYDRLRSEEVDHG